VLREEAGMLSGRVVLSGGKHSMGAHCMLHAAAH
jgi:hypothetical protein